MGAFERHLMSWSLRRNTVASAWTHRGRPAPDVRLGYGRTHHPVNADLVWRLSVPRLLKRDRTAISQVASASPLAQ